MEIPDYSYYIFVGVLVLFAFILSLLIYFFAKQWWHNRQANRKKLYFKQLKAVDWQDSKKAAYEVTELGRHFSEDKRCDEIYQQLVPMLEAYKYKKEVPAVDSETLKQYNLLVHVIDESI
ncbi:MAG TPA: hypothetical protein ENK86_03475 [Campylobacterales bacterium]|nr:hypothetical protein [Campylobacterales bacterium]